MITIKFCYNVVIKILNTLNTLNMLDIFVAIVHKVKGMRTNFKLTNCELINK